MATSPTILLVDDEPAFLESTAELLRNDGYCCSAAENAYQAMKLLDSHWHDLLIADIKMPGNRNLEFIERARRAMPGLPVILVTGYASTDTAIASIHLPVVAYLRKPLPYDELRPYVTKALVHSATFRTVSQAQERLRQTIDELDNLKHQRWAPGEKSGNGEVRIPGSTLRTLAATVSELVALEVSAGSRTHLSRTCELLECPRWPFHRKVIREAVAVLCETKRRFKSKELAEVRQSLQALIEEPDESDCR